MSKNVANLPYACEPVRGSITTYLKNDKYFEESNSRSKSDLKREENKQNNNLGLFFEINSKNQSLIMSSTNLRKNWRKVTDQRNHYLNQSIDLTNKHKFSCKRNESISQYNKISLQDSFRGSKSHICDVQKFMDTTMNSLNKKIEQKSQINDKAFLLKTRSNELQLLIFNSINLLNQNEKYLDKLKINTKRIENDCDNIRESISELTSKADEKTKVFEEIALKLKNQYDFSYKEIEKLKEHLKQESKEYLMEKSRLKQNIRKLELDHLEANDVIDSSRKKQMEIKRNSNEALGIIKQKSLLMSKMFNDSLTFSNIKTIKNATPAKIISKRHYPIKDGSKIQK